MSTKKRGALNPDNTIQKVGTWIFEWLTTDTQNAKQKISLSADIAYIYIYIVRNVRGLKSRFSPLFFHNRLFPAFCSRHFSPHLNCNLWQVTVSTLFYSFELHGSITFGSGGGGGGGVVIFIVSLNIDVCFGKGFFLNIIRLFCKIFFN